MEINSRICNGDGALPTPPVVLLSPMDVIHVSQMPILIFYSTACEGAESMIEKGLAKVLGHYAELSGRIGKDDSDRHCIHLNNAGAFFVEAKCKEEMTPYLEKHGNNHEELVGSSTLKLGELANEIPLIIQVTRFACNGLAISWEGHHRVSDGVAHAQFLLDWASCSKSGAPTSTFVPLVHDRPFLMPRNPPVIEDTHAPFVYEALNTNSVAKNVTTISVCFSAKQIADLKSLCSNKFTTYETLAAHLWRCMTAARSIDKDALVGMFCPANGRSILNIPPGFYGNAAFHCFVQTTAKELLDNSLQYAANLIKQSVKRCSNQAFIKSVVDYLSVKQEESHNASQPADASWEPNLMVASWSRFPFYEVDFGFGNPTRLSTANVGTEGTVTIGPPRKEDGSIEVFVNVRKNQVSGLLGLIGK